MAIPSASELLERAKELAPFFSDQAEANEQAGRLSEETVAAMRDTGLFGLMVPRCYGGSEAWPVEALDVIEAVSYADASTGWVLMAAQVSTGTGAAYLHPRAADEIFDSSMPIITGQGGAMGRADVVDGGFMLTGNWRYGSGLLHGDYTHNGAIVYENGEPRKLPGSELPEVRIMVVPVAQADLLANWDVIGLRATGSIDYTISNVFVPEDYTHHQIANKPRRGGDLYRIAIHGMGAIGHAGVALGIGRRVLDELVEIANEDPTRSGMIPTTGGNDSFHEQFGAAEARYRSARALVREAQQGVQNTIQRGEDPSVRDITLARLALQNVNLAVSEVCAFAYKFGGGVSLRESVIQRCLRDMHAATQHGSNAPPIIRDCGRELLGVAPGLVWGGRGLIEPVDLPD